MCRILVFGIVVVWDQLGLFAESNNAENLAMVALWLIQAIVTIPNKVNYDEASLPRAQLRLTRLFSYQRLCCLLCYNRRLYS